MTLGRPALWQRIRNLRVLEVGLGAGSGLVYIQA